MLTPSTGQPTDKSSDARILKTLLIARPSIKNPSLSNPQLIKAAAITGKLGRLGKEIEEILPDKLTLLSELNTAIKQTGGQPKSTATIDVSFNHLIDDYRKKMEEVFRIQASLRKAPNVDGFLKEVDVAKSLDPILINLRDQLQAVLKTIDNEINGVLIDLKKLQAGLNEEQRKQIMVSTQTLEEKIQKSRQRTSPSTTTQTHKP